MLDRYLIALIGHTLLPITTLFGVIGNSLSFVILCTKDYRSKDFGRLLILLCLADTLCVISTFSYMSVIWHSRYGTDKTENVFAFVMIIVSQTSLACSVFATVAIALERYLVIKDPFRVESKRGKMVPIMIFVSVLLSILITVPLCFEAEIVKNERIKNHYRLVADPQFYSLFYHVIHPIVTTFIPLILITILSVLIIINIRKAEIERQNMSNSHSTQHSIKNVRRVTLTLFAVIAVFLACHSFRIVYLISVTSDYIDQDGILDFEDVQEAMADSVQEPVMVWLLVLNSSCNVVLYTWRDPKFRRRLINMLCLRQLACNVETHNSSSNNAAAAAS